MSKYVRKTHDVWVMMTNYGYGWEEECEYDNYADAKRDLAGYRECCHHYGGGAYLKKKRIRNEAVSA
jgi:hypothetical protein